uniref:Reverse transcriptase Ty1/copia-type domain-containing protein n=1 Tax=Moniliophthora roreri TaxID=221103 RepID=A0A0W0FDG7_MONRR
MASALSIDNVHQWQYKDILTLSKDEQKKWMTACYDELKSLQERNVYKLVDLPQGRKVIKSRWVFDVKTDGRYKARLVAKGFSQVKGIDYDELFSPVVHFETVRVLLALAALEDWEIQVLDVKTAFLYGELDKEIYMEQPQGFIKGSNKVWLLRRALYGLKQASLSWWYQCTKSMAKLGFKHCISDAGVYYFIRGNDIIIAIVYVDDVIFMGSNSSLLHSKKKEFMKIWECRDLGEPREFLRMQITRDRKRCTLSLDQSDYLEKIIKRFGMENANPTHTPLPASYKPTANKGEANSTIRSQFQSVIRSLLYLCLGTRPDITFPVIKLLQYGTNPTQKHLNKVKYIIRYLIGTRKYSLTYKDKQGEQGFIAYADSDWVTDEDIRVSQTGYLINFACAPVFWVSQKQKSVALSSTEAEYMALSDCARQIKWIINLFSEIEYPIAKLLLLSDNQGAIFISKNQVTEKQTKHIDIEYHHIRECVAKTKVEVFFIPTNQQPVDLMMKNLPWDKFQRHREFLGLTFFKTNSSI